MRGYVGIGQSDSVEEAVSEATQGLKNADLIIMTAPYAIAATAASLLHEKYPHTPIIGTTGSYIGKGTICKAGLMVVGFAGVTVVTGVIDDVKNAPIASIRQIEEDAKKIDAGTNNTICMEFITGDEEKTLSTLNSVLSRYDIGLIGGSSHGVPLGEKHMVIYNGKIYNRSCVYAFVKNNAGKIKLFKENIYEKLSNRAHHATLVDTNTKSLFQIDGLPAYEVYSVETGYEKEEVVDHMLTNPLGRAIGDEIYLSATKTLDSNGVMFNGKAIFDNDSIYIMKLADYQQIHQAFIDDIRKSMNRVSMVYGVECLNRLKLFENEAYTNTYLESMSELGMYAAHLTYGQQFNSQHMNQTLVCAVFE
ncbi:MAG: FIST N-terminal domain-containing protein [Wujia sp.]